MRNSIAAIHVAKKQLGLDDDSYRDALRLATGKTSAADMTDAEHQKVLEHFRASGWRASAPAVKGQSTRARKPLDGKFAGKLQALWIAGWNLGLVRDRDDRALLAFVKRQTGIDHVRFLRHGQDAMKAIEGLKGWLQRSGGVDWTEHKDAADCVLAAQVRLLKVDPSTLGFSVNMTSEATQETVAAVSALAKQAMMNVLGERIRALPQAGAQ